MVWFQALAAALPLVTSQVTAHGSHDHNHHKTRKLTTGDSHCKTKPISIESENLFEQKLLKKKAATGSVGRRLDEFQATVPVHFFVITDGVATPITDAQLAAQMVVLNEAFAPTGFEFELIDTTRIINADWAFDGDPETYDMARALRKGCLDTLNVYWMLDVGALGYAYQPDYDNGFIFDGVYMLDQTVPGGTETDANLGDTLVHEVGHWLRLEHTFGDASGCFSNDGDFVDDTAIQGYELYGCPLIGNPYSYQDDQGADPGIPLNQAAPDSCPEFPGTDNLNNYMNYVDDACMDSWTPGQIERMQGAWELFRKDGGESCACAIEISSSSSKSKSAKTAKSAKSKSKNGRGRKLNASDATTRALRKKNGKSGGKGKGSSSSEDDGVYTTQAFDDIDGASNIPTCSGVDANYYVKWFEYEGDGDDVTVTISSANTYTTVTVVSGSCTTPTCVAAAESADGALTGNSVVTFAAQDGVTYWIGVSTKENSGDFTIEIEED